MVVRYPASTLDRFSEFQWPVEGERRRRVIGGRRARGDRWNRRCVANVPRPRVPADVPRWLAATRVQSAAEWPPPDGRTTPTVHRVPADRGRTPGATEYGRYHPVTGVMRRACLALRCRLYLHHLMRLIATPSAAGPCLARSQFVALFRRHLNVDHGASSAYVLTLLSASHTVPTWRGAVWFQPRCVGIRTSPWAPTGIPCSRDPTAAERLGDDAFPVSRPGRTRHSTHVHLSGGGGGVALFRHRLATPKVNGIEAFLLVHGAGLAVITRSATGASVRSHGRVRIR